MADGIGLYFEITRCWGTASGSDHATAAVCAGMSAEDAAELERLRGEAVALEERAEALRATLEETRLQAAGAAAERERLQSQRAGLLAEREAMRAQVRPAVPRRMPAAAELPLTLFSVCPSAEQDGPAIVSFCMLLAKQFCVGSISRQASGNSTSTACKILGRLATMCQCRDYL